MSPARSLDACLDAVAARAADARPGDWIIARGLRTEALAERRPPTADELEDASGARPVVLNTFDLHAMAVSRTALMHAGIDAATPDPDGGLIERDERGRPTGWLAERACRLVRTAAPRPGPEDVRRFILEAQRDLLALGVVESHDMHAKPEMVRELLRLDAAGDLRLRVPCYATPEHVAPVEAVFHDVCGGRTSASGLVELAGVKLFTDGTLNARTAWMLEPFAEPLPAHPRGLPLMTPDQIAAEVGGAIERGYGVAAHAIGDAAVRALLDVYDDLGRPSPPNGPALRIEHAQFIDDADAPRFASMGVVASLQPCHLLTDVEAIRRLLPHRADRAFPLRELIDAAASAGQNPAELVWLGSDTPVVAPDPFDNLQAAVERRRPDMSGGDAIAPAQSVSDAEWRSLQRVPIG